MDRGLVGREPHGCGFESRLPPSRPAPWKAGRALGSPGNGPSATGDGQGSAVTPKGRPGRSCAHPKPGAPRPRRAALAALAALPGPPGLGRPLTGVHPGGGQQAALLSLLQVQRQPQGHVHRQAGLERAQVPLRRARP